VYPAGADLPPLLKFLSPSEAMAGRTRGDTVRNLCAENAALRSENESLRAELEALRSSPPTVAAPALALGPAVARGVSLVHLSRLRELVQDMEAALQPLPSDSSGREALFSSALPVEVWVRICTFLDTLDKLALGRTCRACGEAVRSRGAWLEVDFSSLDDSLRSRGLGPSPVVVDLTSDAPPVLDDPPSAAPKLAAFLAEHPGAASGITVLVLPGKSMRKSAPVEFLSRFLVLLPRCSSLKRLLGLNSWSYERQLEMLRVAAGADLPLEHLHINFVVPELGVLLPRFSSLTSLFVGYTIYPGVHGGPTGTMTVDERLLEQLISCLPRLTRLEIEVYALYLTDDQFRPLSVKSNTLAELVLGGKGLYLEELLCPKLTSCSLHGHLGLYTLHNAPWHDDPDYGRARLRHLTSGCPLLKEISQTLWRRL
jgi:hypothetical protein